MTKYPKKHKFSKKLPKDGETIIAKIHGGWYRVTYGVTHWEDGGVCTEIGRYELRDRGGNVLSVNGHGATVWYRRKKK